MAIQMTSFQKRLLNQVRRKAEKYVRARNQAEYLKECVTKQILPRSLNLVKLVKSKVLWEESSNNDTFEILFEAGVKLTKEQMKLKEERFQKLEKDGQEMRTILKEELGMEKFKQEDQRINKHMLNVYNTEKLQKSKKILRDTRETTVLRDSYLKKPSNQCKKKREKTEI